MFYSHDILTRRGGRFYVLWFSATKAMKLTRRDYANVDIERMCEEIITYLPTKRSGPEATRMKFSLYLSSQLMYGLVLVYKKKQEYLLLDLRRAHELLQTPPTMFATIDLPRATSIRIDLPDALRFATEKTFGEVHFGRVTFSPVKGSSISGGTWEDEVFSTHTASLLESIDSEVDVVAPHTAHPSKITLKEDLAQIVRNFGAEEDLLPPYENFAEETFQICQTGNIFPVQTEADFLEQQPLVSSPSIAVVSSLVDKTPAVAGNHFEESTVVWRKASAPLVVKASRPLSPEVTVAQVDVGSDPKKEMERFKFRLSPLENEEIDRGRSRAAHPRPKRIKLDHNICISSEDIKKQLDDYQDIVIPASELVVNKERAYYAGKNEWWKIPCLDYPSAQIRSIFQRNLKVKKTEVFDINKVWSSPPWTIPAEFEYRRSPAAAQEFINNFHQVEQEESAQVTASSIEQQRDASSRREVSRERISIAPRASVGPFGVSSQEDVFDRRSDVTAGQTSEIFAPLPDEPLTPNPMEEFRVPEEQSQQQQPVIEQEEEPKAKRRRVTSLLAKDHDNDCFHFTADAPNSDRRTFGLRREHLLNELKEKTAGGRVISFQDLVPLNKSRAQAGKTFYMILDLLGKQTIEVEQRRPYGTISIFGKLGGRTKL